MVITNMQHSIENAKVIVLNIKDEPIKVQENAYGLATIDLLTELFGYYAKAIHKLSLRKAQELYPQAEQILTMVTALLANTNPLTHKVLHEKIINLHEKVATFEATLEIQASAEAQKDLKEYKEELKSGKVETVRWSPKSVI